MNFPVANAALLLLLISTPLAAQYGLREHVKVYATEGQGPDCILFDSKNQTTRTWNGRDSGITSLTNAMQTVFYAYRSPGRDMALRSVIFDYSDVTWHDIVNTSYTDIHAMDLTNGITACIYFNHGRGYGVLMNAYSYHERRWLTKVDEYYDEISMLDVDNPIHQTQSFSYDSRNQQSTARMIGLGSGQITYVVRRQGGEPRFVLQTFDGWKGQWK